MIVTGEVMPAFRHAQRSIRDPEEFSDVVSGASLVADFLDHNTAPTYIEQFQSPGWALDFHEVHVKARVQCPLPPGWASLGLMRSATASTFHGFAVETGMLVCDPPGQAIDGCIEPGFTSMGVNVPLDVWERCRALAGVERPSFGSSVAFRLPPTIYARIERQLRTIRHQLRAAANQPNLAAYAAHEAADFATHVVTTAWELSATNSSPRDSFRNRVRLARRAEEWMRDHLSERMRIPDVCLAMRVSRRELEYAFRSTFDQSPLDHLHALRLNAIRRALRRAHGGQDTVIRLALDHGITHLSRFAAQYHALFGEKPSITLRRS